MPQPKKVCPLFQGKTQLVDKTCVDCPFLSMRIAPHNKHLLKTKQWAVHICIHEYQHSLADRYRVI